MSEMGPGCVMEFSHRCAGRPARSRWCKSRNDLLDILKRQPQLIAIELLRAPAKLCALQLTQQMPQAVILRQRLVALGNRRVALGDRGVTLHPRRRQQRMQRFNVRWELRCGFAHAQY